MVCRIRMRSRINIGFAGNRRLQALTLAEADLAAEAAGTGKNECDKKTRGYAMKSSVNELRRRAVQSRGKKSDSGNYGGW